MASLRTIFKFKSIGNFKLNRVKPQPSFVLRRPHNWGIHLVKEERCYLVKRLERDEAVVTDGTDLKDVKENRKKLRVLRTGVRFVNPFREEIARVYSVGLNDIFVPESDFAPSSTPEKIKLPAFLMTIKIEYPKIVFTTGDNITMESTINTAKETMAAAMLELKDRDLEKQEYRDQISSITKVS